MDQKSDEHTDSNVEDKRPVLHGLIFIFVVLILAWLVVFGLWSMLMGIEVGLIVSLFSLPLLVGLIFISVGIASVNTIVRLIAWGIGILLIAIGMYLLLVPTGMYQYITTPHPFP